MKPKSFRRGIHPQDDGKAMTCKSAIRRILPSGGEMVFPLSQHIGAPAKPVVKPGERVLVGQPIAVPNGNVSAGISSSVSGKVKSIEPRLTVSGDKKEAIVIDNDGLYEKTAEFGKRREISALSPEDIRKLIREAGIVGLGGAGFPTSVKLTPLDDKKVEFVLVNGAECEPYLTSDHRLMLERPDELIRGLNIVLSLFPNAKGIIGIENNKPDAIRLLTEYTLKERRISVVPMNTKYPQGGERMLIHALTGRNINSSMLPYDAGCIVDNIGTVVAVYRAVALGVPLTTTVVTVTGDAAANPCNLEVPVGCSHAVLLKEAGGLRTEAEKFISGGPMMGTALFSLDVPVQKISSALLAMSHDEAAANLPGVCIHCGRCVSVCPESLVPQMLQTAADHNDYERFKKLGGMECIECGSCVLACPAHRTLTQSFKYGKALVRKADAVKKSG